MIQGIKVTLFESVEVGVDDFDRPICELKEGKVIDNVLVAPVSNEEVINELNFSGKRVVYSLAIPKGDENNWDNAVVEFFGKRFRVVGIPEQGIETMIPLSWHKKVKVEVYE